MKAWCSTFEPQVSRSGATGSNTRDSYQGKENKYLHGQSLLLVSYRNIAARRCCEAEGGTRRGAGDAISEMASIGHRIITNGKALPTPCA